MAATSARTGATKKKATIARRAWSDVHAAPIVLLTGAEEIFAGRAARAVREELVAADPALEVTDVAADDYTAGQLATLASPSLFGEPRLIRVSRVEKCTDAFLADALEYVAHPAEDTVVVLRHAGGQRAKRLLDTIRTGGVAAVEVECVPLKRDSDKHDFARDEFRRAGKRITPGALRALTTAFAQDFAELVAACGQLAEDAGDEVTESVVERYYGGRVATTAFKVADAAIAGRGGEALIGLRHALESGAEPVSIVAAFASKIRTMARVSGAGGRGEGLGLAPWQVDRARRDLRGWRDEGLGRCLEALAEADAGVKGASRDPVFALERMVRTVASRGRG